MLKRKECYRKLNNSGFTLVELLVAMSILAVVGLIVYSFMNTSSRLYSKTSSDADIQTEAQLAANTVSDLVIDCEVNIGDNSDGKISDKIGTPGGSGTAITVGNVLEVDNSDYQFLIIHDESKDQLFYVERKAVDGSGNYELFNPDKAELLAENVTEFEPNLNRVEDEKILTFAMEYEKTGRKYSGNYQVNLRNNISVNAVVTKPVDSTANVTKVVVTPDKVYINIKGRQDPVSETLSQIFVANSDAKNVTSHDSLYKWTIEGENTGAEMVGSDDKSAFEIRFSGPFNTDASATGSDGKYLPVLPSSFVVRASSTVPNKADGTYPSGVANVYYKKVIGMDITPVRGVINDEMSQKGTATFSVNVSDYNLTTQEKYCDWKLEYTTGKGGSYKTCPAEVATFGSTGTMAYVVLDEKVDETYTFRLTATSRFDPTWSAEYEIGVKAVEKELGNGSPSRGVEIDLESYFMGEGNHYIQSDIRNMVELDKVELINVVNYDSTSADLFYIKQTDGKYYLYLNYDAWRYPYGSRALQYYDSADISMKISFWYLDNNGNRQYREGYAVNWKLDPTNLFAGSPASGTDIVLQKGTSSSVSFSVQGYNITRKNMIGIYFYNEATEEWDNCNANEAGMMDLNPYVAAEYTGAIGNRYTLQLTGSYKVTAKAATSDYPVGPVKMKTTIDEMYRLAVSTDSNSDETQNSNNPYKTRSSYDYNVYVANVEGTGIYVPGPNEGKWNVTDVGTDITFTSPSAVTVKLDCEKDADGNISYYTIQYNGHTYYYNTTYHYWRLKV